MKLIQKYTVDRLQAPTEGYTWAVTEWSSYDGQRFIGTGGRYFLSDLEARQYKLDKEAGRMTRYDFEELREKALRTGSREDIEALVEWLQRYDPYAWNGESWDIGRGYSLHPLYNQIPNENGDYDLLGWEIF